MPDIFSAKPPLVRIDETSNWYGIQALSSLYGGQSIARDTSKQGERYRWTVIPLPVSPINAVTLERLADAVATSLTGRLEDMVDVYRLSVERDGWMDSILRTMAHGLLGMPLAFQGDPAMCSALLNADGTPGDFEAMHPEAECAKIFADGIGLGFGLGQYVLMCWRCKGVDWLRASTGGAEDEVCKTCMAARSERPDAARELFQLRWRDARWLFRQPITGQWFYNGRQGLVPVNPGDGEWFLFTTVPDVDIWRHGPWTWGCVAAIMARDSRYDAVNTSRVCAPMIVFQATAPTAQNTRQQVNQEAKNYGFGNSVTLPHEWSVDIKAAKAEFMDVATRIQEDSTGMWEVGVTGNNHGMKSGPGFANMDVYARVTARRRAFYASAWIRQIMQQGLTWWARGNFGPQAVCPVGAYDVLSPEEKLAALKALGEMGNGVADLVKGLKAAGLRPTPAQLVEICQRGGVRVEAIPKNGPQLFDLDAKDAIAGIMINEWRPDQGLPLLPPTDPRGSMMMAAGVKPGGQSTPLASAPDLPPTPPAASPPAAPPAGRLADDELDDEEDDPEDDDERALLAAGLEGSRVCEHGRTHVCERCGVRRAYAAPTVAPDGSAVFRVAWRPVKRKARPRPAAVPVA